VTTAASSPAIQAFVARTTKASGVPYHVADPYVLGRIAEMFADKKRAPVVAGAPKSHEGDK
jgi:hypothetical protein